MSEPSPLLSRSHALGLSNIISHIFHGTQGETVETFTTNSLQHLVQQTQSKSARWLVITENSAKQIAAQYQCNSLAPNQSLDIEPSLQNILEMIAEGQPHLQMLDDQKRLVIWQQHNKIKHLFMINLESSSTQPTQSQITISQFLTPVLISAFHQNLQSKLNRHWRNWRSHNAICDNHGHIIEAQHQFNIMLKDQMPQFNEQMSPQALQTKSLPHSFKIGNLMVEVLAQESLYVAEVYHFDQQIESLTQAETEVAEQMLQGLQIKEIANVLKRSFKTVDNQMQSIFTKLAVNTRVEAILLLQSSDYRFND